MLRVFGRIAPSLIRCSEPATCIRGVKETTYQAGLDVDPQAEKNTPQALSDLLGTVKESIPEGVEYRRHVESYCAQFLKVIEEAPSQGDAEQKLGRQYEEIQKDVQAELAVIERMAEWKPWETDGHAPKVFADVKDMPSNNREFREFQHELGTK